MTPTDYIESIKARLLTDPLITGFTVVKERMTVADGHIRARLTLVNGTRLEFSEYFQVSSDGAVHVVTYSYQWADAHDKLIQRWDNTPHFPDLLGFPHHIHDGPTGVVLSGHPVSIFVILDEISRRLS